MKKGQMTKLVEVMDKREDYHDELISEIVKTTGIAIDTEADLGYAHSLFLNGCGKGPIRRITELSEKSGIGVARLRKIIPVWTREAMRLAREASPLFAMASSEESRATHMKDVRSMRVNIDTFERLMPKPGEKGYDSKYRMLMAMRKEWADAAGITSAIRISEAAIKMEAQSLIDSLKPVEEEEEFDHSAFDV